MKDALKKSLLAGLGAIDFSVEKAREAVAKLVERGEITAEQGKKVVDELVERGKKDSADLAKRIDQTLRAALEKVTVVTKPTLDQLEARVAKLESLEQRIAALEGKAREGS